MEYSVKHDGFVTMGDWIQGPDSCRSVDSYRPWTGTWPECDCFTLFLRARPSLPWSVGGCRVPMVDASEPVFDTRCACSEACCQNPQCSDVQGAMAGYYPAGTTPGTPPSHPSLLHGASDAQTADLNAYGILSK